MSTGRRAITLDVIWVLWVNWILSKESHPNLCKGDEEKKRKNMLAVL